MRVVDAAYSAGLIDGDGSIGFHRHRHNRFPSFAVRVEIFNKDLNLLLSVRSLWGEVGGIRRRQSKGTYLKSKSIHTLSVEGAIAIPILEQILPFLILKRDNAERCLLYWRELRGNRNKIPSDELIERRLQLIRGSNQSINLDAFEIVSVPGR